MPSTTPFFLQPDHLKRRWEVLKTLAQLDGHRLAPAREPRAEGGSAVSRGCRQHPVPERGGDDGKLFCFRVRVARFYVRPSGEPPFRAVADHRLSKASRPVEIGATGSRCRCGRNERGRSGYRERAPARPAAHVFALACLNTSSVRETWGCSSLMHITFAHRRRKRTSRRIAWLRPCGGSDRARRRSTRRVRARPAPALRRRLAPARTSNLHRQREPPSRPDGPS